jgi:ATP-dependent DNA helicase RecQ
MHSHFIEIGARLSPFLRREFTNPAFELLRHVEVFSNQESLTATPADDVLLIHDLVQKALFRGRSPFTPYEVEKLLIDRFGAPLGLSVCQEQEGISLDYAIPQSLIEAYNTYSDFLMPWNGNIVDVPLDPENPQNERRLLTHLKDAFGDRLLHSLYPQFALSSLLGEEKGKHFLGQHGDFLIALPNGKALILEPGDHDNAAEKMRDDQRDQAMREIRIETVRFRNAQIGEAFVRDEIAPRLEHLGAIPFFQPQAAIPEASVAKQMLFLLPSLLARTEWLLNDALLLRGLFGREKLSVVVIERDLPVLELALLSFLHRIQILEQLYGMQGQALPVVDVTLVRKHSDDFCESLQQELRDVCRFTTVPAIPERSYDLSLDLSVTCNGLTPPEAPVHGLAYAVRNTFPFRQPFALRYRSRPRPIIITDAAESQTAATSFLQDFFRKAAFREGQWPIIRQVLQQKDTIGLLPTSAGKSICFQLASLLTPGTTLVVEPTTALIDDQVIGWHSGAQISPKDVGSVLSGNLIVYVAPERLLRPNFRSAMKDLHAADIFVNYAVADEAHCVSMWGHDFRPSYLNLKYNFTEYCTFQGHKAVVVALTGTASQLEPHHLQKRRKKHTTRTSSQDCGA